MAQFVKYASRDGKYVNFGLKLENGFIVPLRPIVNRHYYLLLENSQEVKIEYKERKEK